MHDEAQSSWSTGILLLILFDLDLLITRTQQRPRRGVRPTIGVGVPGDQQLESPPRLVVALESSLELLVLVPGVVLTRSAPRVVLARVVLAGIVLAGVTEDLLALLVVVILLGALGDEVAGLSTLVTRGLTTRPPAHVVLEHASKVVRHQA